MASGGGGSTGAGGVMSGTGGATSGAGGTINGSGGMTGAGGAMAGVGGGGGRDAGVDVPVVDSGAGGSDASTNRCLPGVSPATALLTDFSAATWDPTQMRWGSAGNLTGIVMVYSGTRTIDGGQATLISPGTVDTTAANPMLRIRGDVASADYGGVVLRFDQCVNTTAYSGVRFTLGGTTAGCDLAFQLDTYSQQTVANGGTCVGTCFQFPNTKVQVAASPITVTFASLAGTGQPATAAGMRAEIVGLQLQFQSPAPDGGGVQPSCLGINLTIDDVQLVP